MNWKQFKEACEEAGVTDEMEIIYIDVCSSDTENLDFIIPGTRNVHPEVTGVRISDTV